MPYWILKTEPGTYSFSDLHKDKKTKWDGVRNYQARNNLKQMEVGDLVMIYHSVEGKEIVGLAQVTKTAFPDPQDEDWVCVEIAYQKPLKRAISLAELKADGRFNDLSLVRQGRLSVCPVTKQQWQNLLQLSETKK